MVKATVGGGFLAMPEAFHNIGMVMGVVGTVILGISVLNMMSCIVSISAGRRYRDKHKLDFSLNIKARLYGYGNFCHMQVKKTCA